jgi:hypothetical protein
LRDDDAEILLTGGTANRGQVVRVGDTVRRPQRPTSPATHALLRHLAEVGFTGAPRFLGIDELDREVLSYVPGTAITPPFPDWALTDEALASVAALLLSYHRAVETFDSSPYAWPPSAPEAFRGELISHNDPNLDNVVFRDCTAVALIDFDLSSPGSRLWDIAAAARLWAPLRADDDITDARHGRALGRFRLFVDAYGAGVPLRRQLVDAVRANHDWLYEIVRSGAEHGNPGFADYWTEGAGERAARTRAWYVRNYDMLQAALF